MLVLLVPLARFGIRGKAMLILPLCPSVGKCREEQRDGEEGRFLAPLPNVCGPFLSFFNVNLQTKHFGDFALWLGWDRWEQQRYMLRPLGENSCAFLDLASYICCEIEAN